MNTVDAKLGKPSRFSRRQILEGGVALTATALLPDGLLGCATAKASPASSPGSTSGQATSSGGITQTTPSGPLTEATVTVTTQAPGSIGPAFAGLSYEKASLQDSRLFIGSNAELIGLFKGLGTSVLRIGGVTADANVWTPDGRGSTAGQIAPRDVSSLATFVKATGWQCLYGINLHGATTGATTPALAAAEVAYAVEQFGSSLLGIEIGNEPDLWGMTLANYLTLWGQFRSAILASNPDVKISGPAASFNLHGWTIPFAQTVVPQSEITLLTQHYYRGSNTASTSTAEQLITPDGRIVYELSLLKACLQNTGISFRMAECNSFYSGGAAGVSDCYASSLWAIDYLFNCAQGGSCGANFHGGGKSWYTPIVDPNGIAVAARPLYYGMLFFTLAGQGLLYTTRVSADSLNVTAYAVQTQSGGFNLVIVNKDPTQNLQLTAQLPQSVNSASLLEMTQLSAGNTEPDLTATGGVSIQGATVNLDGVLSVGAPYTLNSNGSQVNCYVPALSAVLIQTTPTPTPALSTPSVRTLVSVYLKGMGGATTVILGNTLQFIAYGVYSNGSTATLPDAYGNKVSRWDTNNHPVAKINSLGVMTNYSAGDVLIKAQIGSTWVDSSNITVLPRP